MKTILLFLVALTFWGCQNPNQATSSRSGLTVQWSLGASPRTLLPAGYPAPVSYDLVLHPASGGSVTQTGLTGSSWTVPGLTATIYEVRVDGRDSGGNLVVSGKGTADLTNAVTANVTVALSYLTGSGTGAIHLTIDASAVGVTVSTATLRVVDPSGATTTPSLSGSDNVFTYTASSAPAGTYQIVATLTSGGFQAVKMESLVVFRNVDTAVKLMVMAADIRQANNTWNQVASLPTQRAELASVAVNGLIYVVGGDEGEGGYLSSVVAYDPATNAWNSKAPMPTARKGLTSAVVSGVSYVVGGYNGSRLNTVEAYDPATDTWTSKAPMPTLREAMGSAVVNGVLYVLGGVNSGGRLSTVEAYDPVTDTWITKTSMPTVKAGLASAVVNGVLYVIGGTGDVYLNTVEAYDPATDTWTTKTPMPTARTGLASAVVNGVIYAMGGWSASGPLDTVEAYDVATDTWTTKLSLPTPRGGGMSGVALNGVVYAIGGYDAGEQPLNTVEAFVP